MLGGLNEIILNITGGKMVVMMVMMVMTTVVIMMIMVVLESNPQLSFTTRMEDWTSLGQHKRHPEFHVVTRLAEITGHLFSKGKILG